MKLSKAIEQFLLELGTTKARATVTAYESDLRQLQGSVRPDSVLAFTPEAVTAFLLAESARGMVMATLHRRMAALMEFGRWGVKRRIWAANPVAEHDRIKRPKTLPRPFAKDEVTRLMALELDPLEHVTRALLFYTGQRVTPLTNILIGHITTSPPTIRVIVKGSKPQLVPVHPALAPILQAYVNQHTDRRAHTFLLTLRGKKLHRKHIERMTAAWGERAEVVKCTPHRFRHTFATELVRRGVDIRIIKEALGHEDINSTLIYTEVAGQAVADGIAKLSW